MAGLTDMLGSLFDTDERYNVPDFFGNLVGGVGDMIGGVGQMGAQAIDDPGSIPSMLGGLPGAMVGDIKRRYTEGDLAENIYEEPASFLFDLLDLGALGKGASRAVRAGSKLPTPGASRLSGLLADEVGAVGKPQFSAEAMEMPNPAMWDWFTEGRRTPELARQISPDNPELAGWMTEGPRIQDDFEVELGEDMWKQNMSPHFSSAIRRLLNDETGAMTPGATPGGYLYHGTGPENLSTIAERGLDAGHWSERQGYAQNFAGPEGAVLRTQRQPGFAPGETPGSLQMGNVDPQQLEMLQGDQWGPLPQPQPFTEADLARLAGETGGGFGARLREMIGSEEGAIMPGARVGRDPNRFYEADAFAEPQHAPMPSDIRQVRQDDIAAIEGDIESLESMLMDEFMEEIAPPKDVYGKAMSPTFDRVKFRRFLSNHPLAETLNGLYSSRRDLTAELTGDAYTAANYRDPYQTPTKEPSASPKAQKPTKGLDLDRNQRAAYWREQRTAAPEGSPERLEATLQGKKASGTLAPSREVKGRRYQGDIEGAGSSIISKADREWLAENPSLRTDPEYHRLYQRARRALEGDVEVGSMLKELGGSRGRVGEILNEGDYITAVRELEDYVAKRRGALPSTLSQRSSVDTAASKELPEDTGYVPGVERRSLAPSLSTEADRLNPYGERLVSEQLLALRKQEPSSLKDYEQEIVSGGRRRRRKERVDPMLVNEKAKPRRKGKKSKAEPVDLLAEFDKGVVERMREAGISDERIAHILGGVKS